MPKSTDPVVYIGDAHTGTDDYKSRASSQKNLCDERKLSRTNVVHLKRQLSSSRLRQQRELELTIESAEGIYCEISENTSNEDVSEATTSQSGTQVLPMSKKYKIFCFCCGIIAAGSIVTAAVVSTRDTAPVPCAPCSDQPPYLWQRANETASDEPWLVDDDGNDPKVNNSHVWELPKDVGWFKFSGEGAIVGVQGPVSGTKNGTSSSVDCPREHYVVSCQCKDHSVCHGAEITSTTRCRVVANGRSSRGAIPRASCVRGHTPLLIRANISTHWEQVLCPDGYRVQSCSLLDYWSGGRQTAAITYTASCTWNMVGFCTRWCGEPVQLTATCFRIDEEI